MIVDHGSNKWRLEKGAWTMAADLIGVCTVREQQPGDFRFAQSYGEEERRVAST